MQANLDLVIQRSGVRGCMSIQLLYYRSYQTCGLLQVLAPHAQALSNVFNVLVGLLYFPRSRRANVLVLTLFEFAWSLSMFAYLLLKLLERLSSRFSCLVA